jgi:predicted DNA binding CopG/RHH family protein
MKYYELDKDEQEMLDSIEAGEWVSVDNLEEEKARIVAIAKNSLNKTMNINIRLTAGDLYRLKTKAAKEGLPYQTLAASILHKATAST